MEPGRPEAISMAQLREEEGWRAQAVFLEKGGCWGPCRGWGQPIRCGRRKGSTSEWFAIFRVPGKMLMTMIETENSKREVAWDGEKGKHQF